jgi:mannosyltransferase
LSRVSGQWVVALYALVLYALVLCLLAPLRPLWLDELLQLSDTYHHSLAETAQRVAHNPGGVPLAYLAENVFVNVAGRPFYMAHAFSMLCAVAGLASLIWLMRLLGVAGGWPQTALLYGVLPISLRYAVEARQYGPALALSVAATALLAWLDQRPDWRSAFLYALALALGMYTQPYVAFVAAAHLIWACRRESFRYVFAGAAIGAALFLPWYLYARGFWMQAVTDAAYQSSLTWKTPPMVLRELSGGGYLLTAALLLLALGGYLRTGMPHSSKRLLALWIFVPLPLVVLANTLFHYFFAIRQLLFIVPPLCVLAGEGLHALRKGWRIPVAVTLAVVACLYDVRWSSHSREDWSLPAAAARRLVAAGTCVLVTPSSAADLYRLYEPSLPFCSAGGGIKVSVVLVSPYATKEQRAALTNLTTLGPAIQMGGSEVRQAAH